MTRVVTLALVVMPGLGACQADGDDEQLTALAAERVVPAGS